MKRSVCSKCRDSITGVNNIYICDVTGCDIDIVQECPRGFETEEEAEEYTTDCNKRNLASTD
jgi:hypothetical protein